MLIYAYTFVEIKWSRVMLMSFCLRELNSVGRDNA